MYFFKCILIFRSLSLAVLILTDTELETNTTPSRNGDLDYTDVQLKDLIGIIF